MGATKNVQLSEEDAQKVEQLARTKLTENNKLNDVIGSQIFQILERNGRVLFYPLEDDDVWGFVEKTAGGNFVCINTSIEYDKQVFVAAHELYHIWSKNCAEELILASNLEGDIESESMSANELKANRFAAALLVNGDLLQQEMRNCGISRESLTINGILTLANLFVVPYKTMLRRLYELKLIDERAFQQFLLLTHERISILKNRMSLILPQQDNAIKLNNLVEIAMSLYDRKLITIDKLEQILEYSNLTLADMGIKRVAFKSPTDSELDELLED